MAKYQGHRSWNAWNVSLWIANDERLYRFALDCIASNKTRHGAVNRFLQMCGPKTPDGARYNYTCVMEAFRGLE